MRHGNDLSYTFVQTQLDDQVVVGIMMIMMMMTMIHRQARVCVQFMIVNLEVLEVCGVHKHPGGAIVQLCYAQDTQLLQPVAALLCLLL